MSDPFDVLPAELRDRLVPSGIPAKPKPVLAVLTTALPLRARKKLHWVRPDLVAEIGFTEWTRDGRLRHPRFLGLRSDKDARKVVRETAAGGNGHV